MATGVSGRDELLRATIEHVAASGVASQSLRGLAAAIGTSHRMLLYHFGSWDGLLAAVVAAVEEQQRETFADLVASAPGGSPRELALEFWSRVVGPTLRYGPLFFELSAHAMQGRPHADALRSSLVAPWLEALTAQLEASGTDPERARTQARLGLAVARGLLFDLLVTGERADVDAAMALFVDLAAGAERA